MKIRVSQKPPRKLDVQLRFETVEPGERPAQLTDKVGDLRLVERPGGRDTREPTLLISLGPQKACTTEICRRAAGTAAGWLIDHHVRRAGLDADHLGGAASDEAFRGVCEGLALGAFRFDRHRTGTRSPSPTPTIEVWSKRASALRRLARDTGAISEAVNLAREWGHEPANVVNPVTLAERIKGMARRVKLQCKVLDERALSRMKAGAILAVGGASPTPPRLIVLEYRPSGRNTPGRPVALVGKAITFDTGGYSLKDREGMVGMKYDKCGAMAVIGAMHAVAASKPKTPVVAVIVAAENMVSGDAYRPNDIIKTMSGKTVEIISTDAEGRMVLADALTYVQKNYKPRAIIDLATLTGGVVVALGSNRAGLFASDDRLAASLLEAGDHVHERLWRLPLDTEYFDLIKGDDSDIKNAGGRQAQPVQGAIFLQQFVNDDMPWAHLDVAGTAINDKDQPYCPKGATGFGVRLLVEYIRRL